MTSTQQFILAILTVLIPVVIPAAVALFFQAKKIQLERLKGLSEQYKDTIKNAIITAESIFKEGHGDEKYDWVIDKVSDKIKIPPDELKMLVEGVLTETKKSLAEEWNKLGTTKP